MLLFIVLKNIIVLRSYYQNYINSFITKNKKV